MRGVEGVSQPGALPLRNWLLMPLALVLLLALVVLSPTFWKVMAAVILWIGLPWMLFALLGRLS